MTEEVSQWLSGLAQGDDSAVGHIWETYFNRLVQLARRKLGNANRRMADEEDVALSAFHSLCKGAAAGRFPHIDDRTDLWKLLATITARKAIAQQRYAHRQKRGGGAVRGESALIGGDESQRNAGINQVLGTEPTPEFVVRMNEQCDDLLNKLHDGSLKTIALMKLESYTNQEIADELGYNPRTIEKKLVRIRQKWERQAASHDS